MGSQPSAISAVMRTFAGPRDATYSGTSGRTGLVSIFRGLPRPLPRSGGSGMSVMPWWSMTSRRRMRRVSSMVSRVRPSGLSYALPCQPSTTCGPDAPRPMTARPPETASSPAAVWAMRAGVRE